MSNQLPPEVLALLGDDATPEKVASGFEGLCQEEAAAAIDPKCAEFKNMHSGAAFDYALAAAAIRAMETYIAFESLPWMTTEPAEADRLSGEMKSARAAYNTLRNWRKP